MPLAMWGASRLRLVRLESRLARVKGLELGAPRQDELLMDRGEEPYDLARVVLARLGENWREWNTTPAAKRNRRISYHR